LSRQAAIVRHDGEIPTSGEKQDARHAEHCAEAVKTSEQRRKRAASGEIDMPFVMDWWAQPKGWSLDSHHHG
jgi:hypothetical protein